MQQTKTIPARRDGLGRQIRRRIRSGVRGLRFSRLVLYVVMLALVLFTSLPLIYVVCTAFKPINELYIFPPQFFVRNPTTQNFGDLLMSLSTSTVPFTRYIFNSVLTAGLTVLCTVMVCSMGAYGLAKHKPKGSGIIFTIIVASLMFSNHVTQIPRYMVVNGMGIINTYAALILPNIAVAYNFFLMKQFIEQFPNELLEAARMDGAGEWTTFSRIVMPSLKPAWCTLIMLSFVSIWNDYFTPLIFTTSQTMKTLPLALQTIAGGPAQSSIGRMGAVSAATFLMTVPTIVLFLLMQRRVMETMVYSGIKA
ncbi:MAG TPA: carbohydrate ABC transporter permease [Firmicutes bacterium]|nr:carbohydrate ABC transporter permease [Bacillota bacterium]